MLHLNLPVTGLGLGAVRQFGLLPIFASIFSDGSAAARQGVPRVCWWYAGGLLTQLLAVGHVVTVACSVDGCMLYVQ